MSGVEQPAITAEAAAVVAVTMDTRTGEVINIPQRFHSNPSADTLFVFMNPFISQSVTTYIHSNSCQVSMKLTDGFFLVSGCAFSTQN